jgi:hypothetical protein
MWVFASCVNQGDIANPANQAAIMEPMGSRAPQKLIWLDDEILAARARTGRTQECDWVWEAMLCSRLVRHVGVSEQEIYIYGKRYP